jgi:hypothetical protein
MNKPELQVLILEQHEFSGKTVDFGALWPLMDINYMVLHKYCVMVENVTADSFLFSAILGFELRVSCILRQGLCHLGQPLALFA